MANIPMDDETRKKLIEELLAANAVPTSYWTTRSSISSSVSSPQPVETDEQGNIIGYKVLIFDLSEGRFMSPLYPVRWSGSGWLESDRVPEEKSIHGIYTLKSVYNYEITKYYRQEEVKLRSLGYRHRDDSKFIFVVRCIISGVIIEGEHGFRSQYAKIEGVQHNGYWKTYQDFYQEARNQTRSREDYPSY
jgi:hypothetical protein